MHTCHYTHTGAHTRTHTHPRYEGSGGPLLILQVKSGKNCKCCICILICSQSGIVFGVAVKLPAVCTSSPFIEGPWKTGPKFKCECYRAAWRWDLLSVLFSSLLFVSQFQRFQIPPAHHSFQTTRLVFSMFSPYFASTLVLFFITLHAVFPSVLLHLTSPILHYREGENHLDFISMILHLWKAVLVLDSDFVLSSLTNSCLFPSLHLAFSVLITPQI